MNTVLTTGANKGIGLAVDPSWEKTKDAEARTAALSQDEAARS